MRIYFGLIGIMVLLSGCSSLDTKKSVASKLWQHSEHNNKQVFYKDSSECMAMSGAGNYQPAPVYSAPSVNNGGGFAGGFSNSYSNMSRAIAYKNAQDTKRLMFNQCMLGKGYYK